MAAAKGGKAEMERKGTEALGVDPVEALWAPGATQFPITQHRLTNTGTQRLGLKVKCSHNDLYRLRPVFSILEPGKSCQLTVARIKPAPAAPNVPQQRHKIVFHLLFLRPIPEDADPQAVWKRPAVVPNASRTLLLNPIGNPGPNPVPNPAQPNVANPAQPNPANPAQPAAPNTANPAAPGPAAKSPAPGTKSPNP